MNPVISVEGISKRYRIGIGGNETPTIVGSLVEAIKAPVRNYRRIRQMTNFKEGVDDPSVFWALKDINFSVNEGDILGIIGHNGAGKSTLLKILSKITAPTSGQIALRGRLASLLEVGTGFHSELTGRQNVYMNGTILGMRRAEIDRKLDEIIEFSGVEKHLDTPVKFYSSGMKVRLGFAVAAHLDPEILIIDEVLAVGDTAFQRKCLGKMDDVSKSGKTILFVSHSMQAVRSLCKTAMVLKAGQIIYTGEVEGGIRTYESSLRNISLTEDSFVKDDKLRRGNGDVRFTGFRFINEKGEALESVNYGDAVHMEVTVKIIHPVKSLLFCFGLRSPQSGELVVASKKYTIADPPPAPGETVTFTASITQNHLRPAEFGMYLWVGDKSFNPYDVLDGITEPLLITAEHDIDRLGFDPATSAGGLFDVPVELHRL